VIFFVDSGTLRWYNSNYRNETHNRGDEMATRSTIACKLADGSIRQIYCHWDGYPSNNGQLLLDHYNSQELAELVTSIGDMSLLAASVECPKGHSFDNRVDGYTVFYGRDRGENGTEPRTHADESTLQGEDYNYLWDGKKWLVDGEPLTPELINGENEN
jgi:hypothetical protein